jgi:hypothetical protein
MILRFIPLEGSEGRRGKVFGEGDCPEEGGYLTLTFEGQEYDDYQVTFSHVDYERPYLFSALVVRDSESLP